MMIYGLYLLIRRLAGGRYIGAYWRFSFACWRTGRYYNIISDKSQRLSDNLKKEMALGATLSLANGPGA
jgi:hypothetical protein